MVEPSGPGRTPGGTTPTYDYILAVDPGRLGTTFLYRLPNTHPGFRAPEIKEAHYYHSARLLERTPGGLAARTHCGDIRTPIRRFRTLADIQ